MKDYKEMTRCIIEARDAYLEKKRKQKVFIKRCIIVGSICCLCIFGGIKLFAHNNNNITDREVITTKTFPQNGGVTSQKTRKHWDEMTVNQQYNLAILQSIDSVYQSEEQEISSDCIVEFICKTRMMGWNVDTNETIYCEAKAYSIREDENRIAIQFLGDDHFYLYKKEGM